MHRRRFQPSITYSYLTGRSIEGTLFDGSRSTGVFVQTAMRVNKGWGVVSANKCAAITNWPPPPLDPKLDQIARYLTIPLYVRVRNRSDLKVCLAHKLPVLASFYINHNHWLNAKNGEISDKVIPNDIAHCITVTGYSNTSRLVRFVNSWGGKWGDSGAGSMSFDYFDKHLQEAYVIVYRAENPNRSRMIFNSFGVQLPLGHYECGEIRDPEEKDSIGWLILKYSEFQLEIEELYVRPTYRRQGHAVNLLGTAVDMAKGLGLELVGWIGLVDITARSSNIGAISALCNKFQLTQHAESLSWSKYSVRTKSKAPAPASVSISLSDEIRPGCVFESVPPISLDRAASEFSKDKEL